MSGERPHSSDDKPVGETTRTSDPVPGTTWHIADYRVIRKIGEGGMGMVFEAEQQHPRRPVALKVIRGGRYVDEHHVRLFEREAQALARLKHPGIAAIYESGRTDDGQHFFAMELLRGRTLEAYARERFRPPLTRAMLRELLTVFLKICDAVAYAHQRGVIHRDLKPSNIIVQRESFSSPAGSSGSAIVPEVKILDFGLARITDPDLALGTIQTDAGWIQGSLPYMTPEQIRGNPDEIDVRTDVYSLGVILYELISGRLPYDVSQTAMHEAARVICEEAPASLSGTRDGRKSVDRDLITIVFKALEKETSRRYQSVSALQDDIARYLSDQPILAHPPSAAYQLRKLVIRHKAPFITAAVVIVLLAAFAVAMTIERNKALRAEQRASSEAENAKQVADFLVRLFEVSDPGEARGRSVTAREILDEGARRIDVELRGQPLVQARLMDTIGRVYLSLGLYGQADQFLQSSLDQKRRLLGIEHLEVAASLNDRAELLLQKGDARGAATLFRDSLAMRRRLLPESVPVAESLNNLGMALKDLGQYPEAESTLRQALLLRQRLLGDGHQDTVQMVNNLGTLYSAKGDPKSAEPLYREALARRRVLLGNDHPYVANSLNNLAGTLADKGEFGDAEQLYREALATRRRLYGNEHAAVAQSLNNLGSVLRRKGDLDGAEAHLNEALAINRKRLGDVHPEVANQIFNLGHVAVARKDYALADQRFRESLAMRRKIWSQDLSRQGPEGAAADHPDIASAMFQVGSNLLRQGRHAEAESFLLESFRFNHRTLGDTHRFTQTTIARLVELYEAAGRKDEAATFRALVSK